MDRHGYGVIKVESASAVCPPWICAGARTRRPGVLKRLAGGSRPARLHKWIGAIRDRPRPTFYFHHALLPHEPWIYLPSGHQSRPTGNDPIPGINKPPGFHDPNLTDENHLRHLLQVGFVDRELGLLIRRMRRTGLFDKALLVVVADHGIASSWAFTERQAGDRPNIDEIAAVPFFVKAPGQTEGVVDDTWCATSTSSRPSPTCCSIEVWWRHDGARLLVLRSGARTRQVAMSRRDFSRVISFDRDDLEGCASSRRRWRAAKFGTGGEERADVRRPMGGGLPDRTRTRSCSASRWRRSPSHDRARRRGVVANAALLGNVDPAAQILPTRVTGRLTGSPPEALARPRGGGQRPYPRRGPELPPARAPDRVLLDVGARDIPAARAQPTSSCSRSAQAGG